MKGTVDTEGLQELGGEPVGVAKAGRGSLLGSEAIVNAASGLVPIAGTVLVAIAASGCCNFIWLI